MALNGQDDNGWVLLLVKKLVETLDEYIPEPERAIDGDFILPIEDVFSIQGRGTVVTGRVERGIIKVGEEIEIVGLKDTTKTTCTGVEMFRKLLDEGRAGENVVFCCVVPSVKKFSVVKYWLLQVLLLLTPSSKVRFTYCLRMKVVVTLHSSKATVHSSTSVRLTSLVLVSCQKVLRW